MLVVTYLLQQKYKNINCHKWYNFILYINTEGNGGKLSENKKSRV